MPSRFSFQHQRGLSLVELLVGIAISMIVLVGAMQLFVNHIRNNRQLVLETRVNQDLRAAADLIARDIRRSGYWGNATAAVIATSTTAPASSPYGVMTPSGTEPSSSITYNYSQGSENNVLDSNEQFGFRLLDSGVLQYRQGGTNWQAISDSSTLIVNTFSVTPVEKCVPQQQYCTGGSSSTCSSCTLNAMTGCPTDPTATACTTCPFFRVRRFDIVLQGTSTAESRVVRRLAESVRVRNDQLLGQCP